MESLGQNIEVGSKDLQEIFPTQGLNLGLPHYGWIFLPAEPQGKPKNTDVDSLSLLQGIFLTQESKRGLLFLRKLELELPYDPAIPLLGIHSEETRTERDTCAPVSTAAVYNSQDMEATYISTSR